MWISRRAYASLLAQIQQTENDAKATIDNIKLEVAAALSAAETLVVKRETDIGALLEKADSRVLAAESALAIERREGTRAIRHFASMWLRHNRSFPLPQTKEEKEEAKAEVEDAKNQPAPLTDVQISMRDANRREAAQHGISEEDADRDFEKYMAEMME